MSAPVLCTASAVPTVLMDVCSKTPLHHAAEYGHVRVADRLIAFGADVNISADNGCVSVTCTLRAVP